MSKESALAFRDAVGTDAAIQKQFGEMKSHDDLVALGKSNGFDFTVDECKDVIQAIHSGETELNDFELEMVAGGMGLSSMFTDMNNAVRYEGNVGPDGVERDYQGNAVNQNQDSST